MSCDTFCADVQLGRVTIRATAAPSTVERIPLLTEGVFCNVPREGKPLREGRAERRRVQAQDSTSYVSENTSERTRVPHCRLVGIRVVPLTTMMRA